MGKERIGLVNPCLGTPQIGLILGAFGEVAVEQQVLLLSGSAASCGYGSEHRAKKNCAEQNRAAATIRMQVCDHIQLRSPPACSHIRA